MARWAPTQPWWHGDAASIEAVGAYRFDDPAGEVGIETHLLSAGDGPTMQVPLTYRGAPLEGAGEALVGTMRHSLLGERWVYDASADPVYAAALAAVILTGGTQALLEVESAGQRVRRESTAQVAGSGSPEVEVAPIETTSAVTDERVTTIRTAALELIMRRVLDGEVATENAETLTGVWVGNDTPVVLALARRR
ncbi:MAG TPA: hypothetical protein VNU19_02065 [Candidatus Acidoferrum sp.]|jgi:hypothetical protein|nr:hypothetical protein [Candidatus Acidoferrum sp.]